MSGPCTDCGGPDYQTLVARIAELEAANERLALQFDAVVILRNAAHSRAERAEAECDEAMATMYHERGDKEQAEVEVAARDRMLEDAAHIIADANADMNTEVMQYVESEDWEIVLADLRARAEEGSDDE